MEHDWLDLCREERIDPDEVRLVFDRYAVFKKFHEEKQGAEITLDQWFRFYHMEKATEGDQTGPSPSGCSVDSDAVNNACIKRPGPFLTIMKAYRADDTTG